jgi:hypothetical protein
MNSTDLLTKLLAHENLTILRENVPTASFDIKNRVLRLPVLLNMNASEEFMMSLHEVGHALYTDTSYISYIEQEKSRKSFGSYMNILEDARIERMIKEYYPGVRKDFFSGYASLNERDFFGISGKNVNTLCLIDRINIYFKVGVRSGVRFNSKERELVFAAERTETIAQVYDLALKVYDLSLEQKRFESQAKQDLSEAEEQNYADDEEESDDYFSDYEDDEGEEDSEELKTSKKISAGEEDTEPEEDDSAPESTTQKNFDDAIKNNIENPNKPIHYIVPGSWGSLIETSYKELIKDIDEALATYQEEYDTLMNDPWYRDNVVHKFNNPHREDAYKKFRVENNKAVAHLFKEFEMRKAARRYSRSQVSPSGSLNMRKIHNYRTSGEIFSTIESVLDDKNHSFLMFLDWSGSMQDHLQDSIGQVITLASFCRRAKIPFKVIAFRDADYAQHRFLPKNQTDGVNGLNCSNNLHLFTLFDSTMTSAEFDKVAHFTYACYLTSIGKYDLTGTPLLATLSYAYNYIPTFQKFAGTEKTSLIIVSDGASSDTSAVDKIGNMINRYSNSPVFIRCKYTGKVYNYNNRHVEDQCNTIMTMIGNAFPSVSRVSFFVADHRSSYSINEFNKIYGLKMENSMIRKQLREKGFCDYPSTSFHKLFVIPCTANSVSVDLSAINKEMTPAQISKKMSSAVGRAVNSRVVLTKFVETIS